MFGREPVVISAAISFAIKAVMLALMAFGLDVSERQLAAVLFAVDAVLALAVVLVVRPQTMSMPAVNDILITANDLPANTPIGVIKSEQAAKDKAESLKANL